MKGFILRLIIIYWFSFGEWILTFFFFYFWSNRLLVFNFLLLRFPSSMFLFLVFSKAKERNVGKFSLKSNWTFLKLKRKKRGKEKSVKKSIFLQRDILWIISHIIQKIELEFHFISLTEIVVLEDIAFINFP